MFLCNGLKNSFKYFSTGTITSKAPVTPATTPENQLGRYFSGSGIIASSLGFPRTQWGATKNNTRELETNERERRIMGTVKTKIVRFWKILLATRDVSAVYLKGAITTAAETSSRNNFCHVSLSMFYPVFHLYPSLSKVSPFARIRRSPRLPLFISVYPRCSTLFSQVYAIYFIHD